MLKLDKIVYGGRLDKGNDEGDILKDRGTGIHYLLVAENRSEPQEAITEWVSVKFNEDKIKEKINLEFVTIVVGDSNYEGLGDILNEEGMAKEEYAGVAIEALIDYIIEITEEYEVDLEVGKDFIEFIAENITEDALNYYYPTNDTTEEGEYTLIMTDTVLGSIEVTFEILEGIYTGLYMDNITLEIEKLNTGKIDVTKGRVEIDERMIEAEDDEEVYYIKEAYMESLSVPEITEFLIEGLQGLVKE